MHRAQPFLSLLHRTYIHHARQAGRLVNKVGRQMQCNAHCPMVFKGYGVPGSSYL